MKCGFSSDLVPKFIFPSIIARPRNPGITEGSDINEHYIGNEALSRRGIMKNKRPMELSPEDHSILLTQSSLILKKEREKMSEIMFETFNVKSLYIGIDSVLSLLSTGRKNGIIVDSGYSLTSIVPIFEGYVLPHAIFRINQAGKDITDYLIYILIERGYEMTTSVEKKIVGDIKERVCYVSLDYETELTKAYNSTHSEHEYDLPDNSKMVIAHERFRAPEIMFNPSLFNKNEIPGIQDTIFNSIQKCKVDFKKELYKNIVLVGGSTMFKNFKERLIFEIQKLAPKHSKINIDASDKRKFSAWIGGSILSKLSNFQKLCVTQNSYGEEGKRISIKNL